MKRITPSNSIIYNVTGSNFGLLESMHHGLSETHLRDFYPHLNLEEVLAFAASSWKKRKDNPDVFRGASSDIQDIYKIFSDVFKIGIPWLKRFKDMPPGLCGKYETLNPFGGCGLKSRLIEAEERIPGASEKLLRSLQSDVYEYIFNIEYDDRKSQRGGDNHNLKVMGFQNFYPKKGKIAPAFAREIARILSRYPTEYFLPKDGKKEKNSSDFFVPELFK